MMPRFWGDRMFYFASAWVVRNAEVRGLRAPR